MIPFYTDTSGHVFSIVDSTHVPREKTANRFGVMVWDHKTAGACQVMSGDSFNKAKQYMARPGHRSGIQKLGYRG